VIELMLVLSEERLQVGLVKPHRTLGLREGEKEQKERFYLPIEGEPADEPPTGIFDADEDTDGAPVHGKVLDGI